MSESEMGGDWARRTGLRVRGFLVETWRMMEFVARSCVRRPETRRRSEGIARKCMMRSKELSSTSIGCSVSVCGCMMQTARACGMAKF